MLCQISKAAGAKYFSSCLIVHELRESLLCLVYERKTQYTKFIGPSLDLYQGDGLIHDTVSPHFTGHRSIWGEWRERVIIALLITSGHWLHLWQLAKPHHFQVWPGSLEVPGEEGGVTWMSFARMCVLKFWKSTHFEWHVEVWNTSIMNNIILFHVYVMVTWVCNIIKVAIQYPLLQQV